MHSVPHAIVTEVEDANARLAALSQSYDALKETAAGLLETLRELAIIVVEQQARLAHFTRAYPSGSPLAAESSFSPLMSTERPRDTDTNSATLASAL